ncbi:hypothetical protein [Thermococcus sp.]|uniref:hypothetical protein n=1 Tax=Thermococcus sp. TaxID=35749 RepID=UPI00198DBF7E|nr:hypothetical protein [Thermococcus sp.]MBC7095308.1 hypothetical protein [Thermococcus sp.]
MSAMESAKIMTPTTFTIQCISNVLHEERHLLKLSTPIAYPSRAVNVKRAVALGLLLFSRLQGKTPKMLLIPLPAGKRT